MTGGPGAKGAPPFTDEELAAIGAYLPELRRSVAGQRILYTSLAIGSWLAWPPMSVATCSDRR